MNDNEVINSSGLFFFLTKVNKKARLKIIEWYNNLSKEEQKFVNILRNEAIDEADYFSEQARD